MYGKASGCKRYRYKKRRSAKTKFRIFAAILLGIIVPIFVYYFAVVTPIVCSLSEEKIRSLSTIIISNSVGQALEEREIVYDKLVNISYNDQNEITLIETDTVEVNKLVRRVTEIVQQEMNNLGLQGISVKLGTFSGIPFLYGIGPDINLKLVPVGTVNTEFKSAFSSAGINQTKHSLSFNISASVGMILPAKTQNFLTTLEVAICDYIIVGTVPQVYLSSLSAQK